MVVSHHGAPVDFPFWVFYIVSGIFLALGALLMYRPNLVIDLVRRDAENSPITRWYMTLWWTRWWYNPTPIRVSGAALIIGGVWMLFILRQFIVAYYP
jgi:RsiW-degrading membrane proteinase PrsW (M82 family)